MSYFYLNTVNKECTQELEKWQSVIKSIYQSNFSYYLSGDAAPSSKAGAVGLSLGDIHRAA